LSYPLPCMNGLIGTLGFFIKMGWTYIRKNSNTWFHLQLSITFTYGPTQFFIYLWVMQACGLIVYLVPHTRWFTFHMAPMRLFAGPDLNLLCTVSCGLTWWPNLNGACVNATHLTQISSRVHDPHPCPPMDAWKQCVCVVNFSSGSTNGSPQLGMRRL
jgi:hypothetical protein